MHKFSVVPAVHAPRLEGPRFFVYALFSLCDGSLYVGYTSNLRRRLHEHRQGKTASTAYARPHVLVFCESFLAMSDAMRREAYLKTPAGRKSLQFNLAESLEIAQRLRERFIREARSLVAAVDACKG